MIWRQTAIRLAAVVLVLAQAHTIWAEQLCEATVNCLPVWDTDTLVLPMDAVALSPTFSHCSPPYFVEAYQPGRGDTVSVMFVIDHSNSMSIMDTVGSRYRLTERLIDSIHANSPASEVGIIVFSNQLLHNAANDPFYTQLYPDSGWTDSYAPLTKLSDTINSIPATTKLKNAIALSQTVAGAQYDLNPYKLANGYYGPSGRTTAHTQANDGFNGSTDITLAMEAARQAFESATYPPSKQFIIFLSDGIAQYVDVSRQPYQDDYTTNVAGLPTTYTAFWINTSQPIPTPIQQMNTAIRNSDYSTGNSRSKVWKTDGAEDALFDNLLDIVKGQLTGLITSEPVNLAINGVAATRFDSLNAYFPSSFALTGQYTTFSIAFNYHYDFPWDSDSSRNFNVVVRRAPGVDWPADVDRVCWEQGTLGIYDSQTLLDTIADAQQLLTVRLYPPQRFVPGTVTINLSNSSGTDQLTLVAANTGSYYEASFAREYGTPLADNILQNGIGDSIIAVFRNPLLPLDTVRIAVPVVPPRDIAIRKAYFLDVNANGIPDLVRVIQGGDVLEPRELVTVTPFVTIVSDRTLTVNALQPNSFGFDIVLNEPATTSPQQANTAAMPGERLSIQTVPNLPGGGSFPATDLAIGDSMAPVIVSAEYLDKAQTSVRDTLTVIFSEDIESVLYARPFDLKRFPDIANYDLVLHTERTSDSLAVFSVIPQTGQTVPQAGDSIWIDTAGNVSDSKKTAQRNPANIRRLLAYYLLYVIESATYFDTNADGLIDSVAIVTDRIPNEEMLRQLYNTLSLPDYRNFSYTASDFDVTDSGFSITVTQPSGTQPFTGVDSRDILTISRTSSTDGGLIRETVIPIDDNIAPVVNKAVFKPAIITQEGQILSDTLEVTFSEAIPQVSHAIPFLFTDAQTGEQYTMTLAPIGQPDGATQLFLVTSKGKEFPAAGDTLRLNPAAGVDDNSGNAQDQTSRPQTLQVRDYKYSYTAFSAPNPLNLSENSIPADIRSALGITGKTGQVIVVNPLSPLASPSSVSAKLTIYDVVGNTLVSGKSIPYQSLVGKFVFVWDGTNRQGRLVGTGTYLAVISIKDNDGSQTITMKLGVSR